MDLINDNLQQTLRESDSLTQLRLLPAWKPSTSLEDGLAAMYE